MNFNILKIVKEKWHLSYRWKTILMTIDFSSETIRDQKKVAQHFANTEIKELSTRIPYPVYDFCVWIKEKSRHFKIKEAKIVCCNQSYPKRMAIVSSVNGRETNNKGILEHQESWKRTWQEKNTSKCNRWSCSWIF